MQLNTLFYPLYALCSHKVHLLPTGVYEITQDMKEMLQDFEGGFATEEQTANTIKTLYQNTEYIIDPHTAVAASVLYDYIEHTKDKTKCLIASTACDR